MEHTFKITVSITGPQIENEKPATTADTLRAFVAYCETGTQPAKAFALIPYAEAVAGGIPFRETFIFESKRWAVFVTGDFSPEEVFQLETAGIIDA